MDIYNTKQFLKTSTIDDYYWRRSWYAMENLLNAIAKDSDEEILRALSNPNLFEGRT